MKENGKKIGVLVTVAGAVCWGISGCFGQYIFETTDLTAEWLVNIRLLSAGILLLLIGVVKDGAKATFSILHNRQDLRRFVTFSIFGMLLCQYAFFGAIQRSNAATATVLQSCSPVLILLMVCLRRRTAPRLVEYVAIAGCLAGSFLLCTHGDFSGMQLSGGAIVYGVGAAFGGALYTVLSGPLLQRYSTWTIVGGAMFTGGIAMAVVVRPWNTQVTFTPQLAAALVGVVVIGTAVAFSLFLKGTSMVGPMMAALLGNAEPMTSIVISATLLGSHFVAADFAGFLLVLCSVGLLSWGKQKKTV